MFCCSIMDRLSDTVHEVRHETLPGRFAVDPDNELFSREDRKSPVLRSLGLPIAPPTFELQSF